MPIYKGSDKIKKIYIGDTKIHYVYYGDQKVWSGSSMVTYIYGGASTTQEILEGEECASKTVTISGATFLGWTTSRGSTSPMSSIKATGEPMTLYAIYRWNNASISHNAYNSVGATYNGTTSTVVASGIDGTKYSSIIFYNVKTDFECGKWNTVTWGDSVLGGVTLRHKWWNNNYDDDIDSPGYPCYADASANITVGLANATNQIIYYQNVNFTYGGWCYIYGGATGIGRTVCS